MYFDTIVVYISYKPDIFLNQLLIAAVLKTMHQRKSFYQKKIQFHPTKDKIFCEENLSSIFIAINISNTTL